MKKSIKLFEMELVNASVKNPIIAEAIKSGKTFQFCAVSHETDSGNIVNESAVKFADGTIFKMKKSDYACNLSPVLVSDNMSGKMEGIASVSTSVLLNQYCQQRQKNKNSICASCFAENTVKKYDALEKNLASNTELLTSRIIACELIPMFWTDVVRFESFGDLNNIIQLVNYIKIAVYNPKTNFTLWTKNAFIVRLVKHWFTIPSNLHLIKSSQFVNKPCDNPEIDIFDAIFTVYSKKYLKQNGFDESNFVNCGGRKCRQCMNCYGKKIKCKIINERKK